MDTHINFSARSLYTIDGDLIKHSEMNIIAGDGLKIEGNRKVSIEMSRNVFEKCIPTMDQHELKNFLDNWGYLKLKLERELLTRL